MAFGPSDRKTNSLRRSHSREKMEDSPHVKARSYQIRKCQSMIELSGCNGERATRSLGSMAHKNDKSRGLRRPLSLDYEPLMAGSAWEKRKSYDVMMRYQKTDVATLGIKRSVKSTGDNNTSSGEIGTASASPPTGQRSRGRRSLPLVPGHGKTGVALREKATKMTRQVLARARRRSRNLEQVDSSDTAPSNPSDDGDVAIESPSQMADIKESSGSNVRDYEGTSGIDDPKVNALFSWDTTELVHADNMHVLRCLDGGTSIMPGERDPLLPSETWNFPPESRVIGTSCQTKDALDDYMGSHAPFINTHAHEALPNAVISPHIEAFNPRDTSPSNASEAPLIILDIDDIEGSACLAEFERADRVAEGSGLFVPIRHDMPTPYPASVPDVVQQPTLRNKRVPCPTRAQPQSWQPQPWEPQPWQHYEHDQGYSGASHRADSEGHGHRTCGTDHGIRAGQVTMADDLNTNRPSPPMSFDLHGKEFETDENVTYDYASRRYIRDPQHQGVDLQNQEFLRNNFVPRDVRHGHNPYAEYQNVTAPPAVLFTILKSCDLHALTLSMSPEGTVAPHFASDIVSVVDVPLPDSPDSRSRCHDNAQGILPSGRRSLISDREGGAFRPVTSSRTTPPRDRVTSLAAVTAFGASCFWPHKEGTSLQPGDIVLEVNGRSMIGQNAGEICKHMTRCSDCLNVVFARERAQDPGPSRIEARDLQDKELEKLRIKYEALQLEVEKYRDTIAELEWERRGKIDKGRAVQAGELEVHRTKDAPWLHPAPLSTTKPRNDRSGVPSWEGSQSGYSWANMHSPSYDPELRHLLVECDGSGARNEDMYSPPKMTSYSDYDCDGARVSAV